jgi:DNA-binding transcriptional MerR regulator
MTFLLRHQRVGIRPSFLGYRSMRTSQLSHGVTVVLPILATFDCVLRPAEHSRHVSRRGMRTTEVRNASGPKKGKVMREVSSLSHSADAAASARSREARPQSEGENAELTISQMSRLYDVTLRALRFYEDRGLLSPRREGNARFYRAADRVRFEMILRGKKLGFTLAEIGDLIGGKGATETLDLEEQLQPQQITNQIGHLERQRDEIDTAIQRLRATLDRLSQGAAA